MKDAAVDIAVAKVSKYATSESGDTLEVIERPAGGLSIVLADGQWSGRSAKNIANKVVRKVVTLLAEGVRDGAAARAASDYLYHERKGKVSATLNILSVDLATGTLVIARNNHAPVFLAQGDRISTLEEESSPVGVRRGTRPVIAEIPVQIGLTALAFTDGLLHAGDRFGNPIALQTTFQTLLEKKLSSQEMADALLELSVERERGRPSDDISIVVLQISVHDGDLARRMNVHFPIGAI